MRIQKYKRGQIWWYNNNGVWDGGTYNQGKSRPVIIVSNEIANANSNTLIAVPCTSQDKKEMATHITFEINDITNIAMAEGLMSVSTDKLGAYIGTLDNELIEKLEGCMLVALGMRNIIKENALKRNNIPTPTNPIPIEKQFNNNLYTEDSKPALIRENNNYYIRPDIDYAKKDLALTLQMVEDAKKAKATDLFSAKLNHEIKSEPKVFPKNKVMTLEEKKQFLKDYETKTKKYMLKKYNLKNDGCLFTKVYNVRKQLASSNEAKKEIVNDRSK